MICAALALLCLPPLAPGEETVHLVSMLQNGDFRTPAMSARSGVIPWWIHEAPGAYVVAADEDAWLLTEGEARVVQPVPAFAPLVEQLVVRGHVRGLGRVILIDGQGQEVFLDVGQEGIEVPFEWTGSQVALALGEAPTPRLNLALEARGETAVWSELEVLAAFPLPTEEALREEVVAALHYTLDPWIERGVDTVGERKTGLYSNLFDAITGESIVHYEAGFHPLAESLLDAIEHEPDPRWVTALDNYIRDHFELCIHPDTGMPRLFDTVKDVPLNSSFLEVHASLHFLLDLHERGPLEHRAQALAIAVRIGEAVLGSGILPDGNIAALYRPRDAAASNETRPIRRLSMPAELTRLAKITGNDQLLSVSRDAVATLLYTHYWPGSWNRIDPGFDDDFGHYAGRVGVMVANFPEEPLFRRLIDTGWDRYRVLWPQALGLGGSMAADQVRCWKLLLAYSAVRPDIRPELDVLLASALHGHLRGQQYDNGAWGDVTYNSFQPKVDLQVGDLPGTPTNLLEGIAMIYRTGLGPSDEDLRALFTGVLRSSMTTYGREYGLLSGMREVDGPNHAGGSVRINPALTLMLAKLSEPK